MNFGDRETTMKTGDETAARPPRRGGLTAFDEVPVTSGQYLLDRFAATFVYRQGAGS